MPDLDLSQIERLCAEIEALAKAYGNDMLADHVPALVGYCRGVMRQIEDEISDHDNDGSRYRAKIARLEADHAALMKVVQVLNELGQSAAMACLRRLPPALLAEVKGEE